MDPAAREAEEQAAADLVERIRRGDSAAEQTLVERYSRGLLLVLRHATTDYQLAEDVHQDAFVVLIDRLRKDGLDDPSKLNAFLHGVARRLLLNHQRKGVRRATVADTERVERTALSAPDPTDALLRRQAIALVRAAIKELSPRDRDVVVRFYLQDEDRDRICQEHGISEKHFYRVLCRARQRLRAKLDGTPHGRALLAIGWRRPGD